MAYSINVFNSWAAFNTWDTLKTWLTSAEGGSLRVVEPKDSDLVLVRYTKGTSDFTKPHVRWCRSVVLNKNTRKVVSVAPPKAVEFDVKNATVAQEFVDGTMMNIYYDSATQSVDVATRSRLGAYNQFCRDGPTFRSMLQDALVKIGVEDIRGLLALDDRNCFTSVVVQHPSNRIVKPVNSPVLSVIHQGFVSDDGSVTFIEDPSSFRFPNPIKQDPYNFQFPKSTILDSVMVQEYTLESILAMPSLKDWIVAQSSTQCFGWQGVVLKDGQGGRWRLRSDVYETVRHLRGNESSAEERFARLRKSRTIEQYIGFYPEDRQAMYNLEGVLRENTHQLQRFYTSVFILRESPFHELPWPFKHHVSVLHNLYKDMLKPHGKKMTKDEVVRYVNRLDFADTANMSKRLTLTQTQKEKQKEKQKVELAVEAAVPEDEVMAM